MKKDFDIYDFKSRIKGAVRQIEEAKISAKNKQLIFSFRDYCSVDGISIPRIERYISSIKSDLPNP